MRTSPPRSALTLAVLVLATLVAAAAPAYAVHRESPKAIAVTTNGTHAISPGRSWDRNLAFSSAADPLGTGSTDRQIFVFSLAEYDCAQGLTQDATVCPPPPWQPLRQVTTGPGAPDNPSVAVAPVTVPAPGGGTRTLQRPAWVAFDAWGSYGGLPGCSAACRQRRQIFLVNLLTNELRRITSGTDGDSVRPSLNSGGGILTFESTAALPGAPGPGGIPQIWVYERDTTFLRRITAGAVPSLGPVPSRDGGTIVFTSAAALAGDGHDTGTLQIFAARYDRSLHQATLVQLTDGDGPSRHPVLSETRSVVWFASEATNLPGGDASAVPRIFSAPVDAGPTPPVTQHTDAATFGACTFPTVDPSSSYLSMLCTGDPLQNGTTGSRIFTRELETGIVAQMTGFGDVQGPITASLGTFFVGFASTADVAGAGTCGRQLALIDFYMTYPGHTASVAKWIGATQPGQLPPDADPPSETHTTAIGKRLFTWQAGAGPSGSQESITVRDGTSTTPLAASGRFTFVIGAPNPFTGLASVGVPAGGTSFPPLPVAGFGALCLTAAADGAGSIDCDGGDAGGDLLIRQDHDADAADPLCLLGCREGASCQGGLPGPHQRPCPQCVQGECNGGFDAGHACAGDLECQPTIAGRCVAGTCASGATPGKACTNDLQCAPVSQCKNELLGVCNGPVVVTPTGVYAAGGMTAVLPIRLALSTDAGVDGLACTPDDVYAVSDVTARLHLTTGTATAAVSDADGHPGAQLAAAVGGAPFDCDALRHRRMEGARLAATLVQLDLPDVPGLRDVILGLRLAPAAGDAGVCSCEGDGDCNDGNPCNGPGQCLDGVCVRTPLDCDDGNPCTEDACDPVLGCSHVPLLDGSACDDGEPCNGAETCLGTVCRPGAALADGTACDDANPCNGAETCAAGACTPGVPLADGTPCSDGNACNGAESCQSGLCVPDAPLGCDDQNPCTTDACVPATGCTHAALLDGSPCGMGDVCGGAPLCMDGVCESGTPLPEGAPCFDGDACADAQTCRGGVCTSGAELDCDDGDPCTEDACDAVLGCRHDPAPDGIPCTLAAGGSGACRDGACRAARTAGCNDNNPCTKDVAGAAGCTHVALVDGTSCWEEAAGLCDGAATCFDGACVVTPAPDCDDGDDCTLDACDPGLGCVQVPIGDLPGVVCRLKNLGRAVVEAPAESFRPTSLRKRLAKLLATARRRAAAALLVDGRRRRNAIRVAERSLARFVRTVSNASSRRKIDRTVADGLVASAAGTRTMLTPLVEGPR